MPRKAARASTASSRLRKGATIPATGFSDYAFHGGGGGGQGHHFYGKGGDGGAALQLVAGQAIRVGDGVAPTDGTVQGLSAGGCGGSGGNNLGQGSFGITRSAGAGGGAGGYLLLEAPLVFGASYAGLAVNGGGGAGGDTSGSSATLSATASPGGSGSTCGMPGGVGAGGTAARGEGTNQLTAVAACTNGVGGGGGGGSIGRVVINTLTTAGPTLAAGSTFFVSPPDYRKGALSAEE